MPIPAQAEVIGMYVHRNLHMFMPICMRLDEYVCCIRYSNNQLPTYGVVNAYLSIYLSTMMQVEVTNYAGLLCIMPARNTHAILLI